MKRLIPFAALTLGLPAAAPAQDWAHAKRVEIAMANFNYTPNRILLNHGEAYVLHFVNRAKDGHNFVAPAFFSSARINPADSKKVFAGEVELDGGQGVDVRIVAPAAGAVYPVHCSHFMHKAFGMKGQIVVR